MNDPYIFLVSENRSLGENPWNHPRNPHQVVYVTKSMYAWPERQAQTFKFHHEICRQDSVCV